MGLARVGIVALLLACCVTAAGESTGPKPAAGGGGPKKAVRIGQYDSRAVAVAWAASKPHAKILSGKMDELKQAKAAGDQAKVKSLEDWGKRHQEKLHRQGFAGADVADIMDRVKDQLPAVAQRAGVDVLVGKPAYVSSGVEVVDVTDEVVKIFEPSERTLKAIEDLRKQPVVDDELIRD